MFKIKLINLLVLEALLLHIRKPMITAYQIIPSAYYTLDSMFTDNMRYHIYQNTYGIYIIPIL